METPWLFRDLLNARVGMPLCAGLTGRMGKLLHATL
jgi:hypothetical protein